MAVAAPRVAGAHDTLDVWRCYKCGRIIAKVRLAVGSYVQIRCAHCGTYSDREVHAAAP